MALETYVPQRGAVTIETLHGGDIARLVVAGPAVPHGVRRARARRRAHASRSTAHACAAKCEADHALGYELLKRFAAVIVERLQATRLRLLDVYGQVPAR